MTTLDPFEQTQSCGVETPLHPALGSARMANFLGAPAVVQAEFMGRIGRAASMRHLRDHLRDQAPDGEDFIATRGQVRAFAAALGLDLRDAQRRTPPTPVWDRRWRDKAYSERMAEERGRRVDPDFDAEKARLLAIDAGFYVERLTEIDVPRSGVVLCPLPTHDERTPSCQLRENRWRCFGCDKHGSIYDLAGALWGLDTYGGQFMEIHKRLVEVFR